MELLLQSLNYVTTAHFFWASMGSTTALGMFIGAILFDGNLKQLSKGLFTIISYAGMLMWALSSRAFEALSTTSTPDRAFASTITVVLITLAWTIGVLSGVFVLRFKYRNKHA